MVNLVKVYGSNEHPSKFGPNVRLPYLVEVEFDAADFIEAKGGAIAAADFYEVIGFPPQTAILGVWAQCAEAFEGSATNLTLNVGDATDPDRWVAAWDFDAATVGTFAARTATDPSGITISAQTNVRVTVATLTGTWTAGAVRVQCLVLDLRDKGNDGFSGIAQLGS